MYICNNEKIKELIKAYELPIKEHVIQELGGISNSIIDTIVEYAYEKVSEHFIGEFYIGKDCLMEYMKFYLSVYVHMLHQEINNKSFTLEQYYNSLSEEKKCTLNIFTKKSLERRWKEFNKFNYIYNEEHRFGKNNISNRQGYHISREQINEMEFLLKNFDNPTIKKIRNNKLCKLKFEELEDYVTLSRNEIDNSNDVYLNIRHYKFERRTHFEVYKRLIQLIEEYNWDIEKHQSKLKETLILLARIPDIKNVNKYTNCLFELDENEYIRYVEELKHLRERAYPLLIGYSIYLIQAYSLEDQQDYVSVIEKNLLSMYNLNDYFIKIKMTELQSKIGDKLLSLYR